MKENNRLFPFNVDWNFGFTDLQLEDLASMAHNRREGRSLLSSPWLYSSSENYSFGKCLRNYLGWPDWLPLPVFSDHGVNFADELEDAETKAATKVHLTFSAWRVGAPQCSGKLVLPVPHPWITYRRRQQILPLPTADGTLLFVPHNKAASKFDFEEYVRAFENNPEEFRPSGLMLSMVDVRRGFHRKLRDLGLPIFSAGNVESSFFVDRFYEIVSHFRYSAGPRLGSHSFLCEELGVPFFLQGKRWVYCNKIEAEVPPSGRVREEVIETVFRGYSSVGSQNRALWTEDTLGLKFLGTENVQMLRKILWREIFRPSIYLRKIQELARKKS